MAERPIPVRRQAAAVVAAGFGQNIGLTTVTTFVLVYLIEYAGVSSAGMAVVTAIITVAKVLDAITDPVMGAIVDMTRTRWGKLRPYLLFSAAPVAALTALMFSVPDAEESLQLLWFGVVYVLWGLAYTACDVPFWGLIGSAFAEPRVRTRVIANVRAFGAISLGLATLGMPWLARALSGGETTGSGWSLAVLRAAGTGIASARGGARLHNGSAPHHRDLLRPPLAAIFATVCLNCQAMMQDPPDAPGRDLSSSWQTLAFCAMAPSSPLGPRRTRRYPVEAVSVGFIGSGFAANLHASSLRQVTGVPVRFAAVTASRPERAAEFARRHGVERVYDDYAELLRDPGVDVVSVCLPNALHAEVVIAAARAGKHIICEKPLTGAFGPATRAGADRAARSASGRRRPRPGSRRRSRRAASASATRRTGSTPPRSPRRSGCSSSRASRCSTSAARRATAAPTPAPRGDGRRRAGARSWCSGRTPSGRRST